MKAIAVDPEPGIGEDAQFRDRFRKARVEPLEGCNSALREGFYSNGRGPRTREFAGPVPERERLEQLSTPSLGR